MTVLRGPVPGDCWSCGCKMIIKWLHSHSRVTCSSHRFQMWWVWQATQTTARLCCQIKGYNPVRSLVRSFCRRSLTCWLHMDSVFKQNFLFVCLIAFRHTMCATGLFSDSVAWCTWRRDWFDIPAALISISQGGIGTWMGPGNFSHPGKFISR